MRRICPYKMTQTSELELPMLCFFCLTPGEWDAGDLERVLEEARFALCFCGCCGDPRARATLVSVTCDDLRTVTSEPLTTFSCATENQAMRYFFVSNAQDSQKELHKTMLMVQLNSTASVVCKRFEPPNHGNAALLSNDETVQFLASL